MKKYKNKERLHKLEELKKRVIEKDRFLKEKAEESELIQANKEALIEMTELSIDEVNRIEKDIEEEFAKRKKKNNIILVSGLTVVLLIVAWAIISKPWENWNKSSGSKQALIIDIDAGTHHLGDNPGNEGTSFSKDFNITDVSRFRSAVFEMTFTKWGPNSAGPPEIIINLKTAGTVTENLPAPGTNKCWDGPAGDGSFDYNCEFIYKKEIRNFLKNGRNSFKIKSGKKQDDFLFSNVRITLIK